MSVIRISGSQLHAARVLAGISRETLAERAGLCRHSILAWEHSSHSQPNATYGHLLRAVSVLESEGVVFSPDGVSLDRARPTMRTVVAREQAAVP